MLASEIFRNATNRYCVFAVESKDYLDILPTQTDFGKDCMSLSAPCSIGSVAKSIDDSKRYVLNGSNNWVVDNSAGSSGSGDGGSSDDIIDEYVEPIEDDTIYSLFE